MLNRHFSSAHLHASFHFLSLLFSSSVELPKYVTSMYAAYFFFYSSFFFSLHTLDKTETGGSTSITKRLNSVFSTHVLLNEVMKYVILYIEKICFTRVTVRKCGAGVEWIRQRKDSGVSKDFSIFIALLIGFCI